MHGPAVKRGEGEGQGRHKRLFDIHFSPIYFAAMIKNTAFSKCFPKKVRRHKIISPFKMGVGRGHIYTPYPQAPTPL